MRTLGRLRAERYRFWSTPSVITSADAMPILLNFCARSLVLGASMSKLSTTFSRSSRASCDRIEHMPARYILRFSFCEKFSSGKFGKILPPPRHSGLATSPARAPPVPFWRQGFLCEWRTSLRPFCARVPRRALALSAVTTWCTSDSLYSRPNKASGAATVAALFPFSLMSLSSITPPWPPAGQLAAPWPLGQPRARPWPTEPPRARPSTALPWATDPWPESLWRWVERRCRGRGFAARILRHPGRARFVMRNRVAVARAIGGKMVALDHPREALALRGAGNVHDLTRLEDVGPDLAADLEVAQLAFRHAEFAQHVTGLDRGLGEMARGGLVDAGSTAPAESDLHRAVAVRRRGLDLRDAVVGDVEHRHRQRIAVIGEDARHADLSADQS